MYTQMLAPHSFLSYFQLHTMNHSMSHDTNAPIGKQQQKALLTFFQASYRPHSSPTASDNKQLWGTREKRRDGQTHTHRQQWIPYSLCRRTHPHCHPVVIVYHTTPPTPRPLHTVPVQQISLPWGTAARQRKTQNEKVMRQRAQLEMLEWDLGQTGCSLKVKLKVGQGEH